MKIVNIIKVLCITSMVSGALLLGGCSKKNDTVDTEPDVIAPPAKTVESSAVSLAIFDTLTGDLVTDTTPGALFEVTISGADDDKIFNGSDTATTTFTGVQDILTFYIRADAADYPLNFQVVVKSSGFVTNSQTMQLLAPSSSDTVLQQIAINMTATALTDAQKATLNEEVGIDIQSAPVTANATAGTSEAVTITTTSIATKTTDSSGAVSEGSGSTTVAIAQGTKLLTKDNTPVVGALIATVTYHNPIDASSLNTFPGGLSVREEPNGTTFAASEPSATFISGGFTSVEIVDDEGNEVRNFDTPITITMTVPKNLNDPTTGNPIEAGASVPLWSYDTDSGEWTAHKNEDGTIITGIVGDSIGDGVVDTPAAVDGDGNWIVAFPTNHLSYFNLDWFAYYRNVPGATAAQCRSTSLSVVGAQGNKIYFVAEAINGGYTHDAWLDANTSAPASETTQINNAPSNFPMRYTAYLNTKSEANKLNSIDYTNLCQEGGVTFTIDSSLLSEKPPITYADVAVNVYDRCENDVALVTPIPSAFVYSYQSGEYLYTITDAMGTGTINRMTVGKSYNIRTYSRTTWEQLSQTATIEEGGNEVDFYFDQTCEVVTPPTGGTGGTGGVGGNTGG